LLDLLCRRGLCHWSLLDLPGLRTGRAFALSTRWTLTLRAWLTRGTLATLSLRARGALTWRARWTFSLRTRWPIPRLAGSGIPTVSSLWSVSWWTLTTISALPALSASTAVAAPTLATFAFAGRE